jgi:uncharacterized protein YciI
MPHFIFTGIDRTDGLDARMGARDAHLAYVRGQPQIVVLGGQLLDDGGKMVGSILVLDLPDMAAAQDFIAKDPYGQAGVFETSELRHWNITIGKITS